MTASIDISPCRHVAGELGVPGDKSISHRALFVAAMAEGEFTITGLSPAQDVASTRTVLEALGLITMNSPVRLEYGKPFTSAQDWEIQTVGLKWAVTSPPTTLDVGNSGSTIRMLLGVLAPSDAEATLSGDASIQRRPMGRVVEPLRAMGANISGAQGGDRAPLTVRGAPLQGVHHRLPVASAQVKSALLFAGLRASGSTIVQEPATSRDHTERMLKYLDVPIVESANGLVVKSIKTLRAKDLDIPGDLSSAAFLLVAAAILPDSEVTIPGVGVNPTRAGILEILRAYGARVSVTDEHAVCGEPCATVTVRAAERKPVEVGGRLTLDAIDELTLVAVLGAYADGETVVRDAGELRVKESDRISAITRGLKAMGVDIQDTPDGFVVRGGQRPKGAEVDSAGDHRIAMALAIAALGAGEPSRITGWEAVGVSYPGFNSDLAALVVP